ncbi:PLD nuclease N-terminal domain-containing protein [Brochothrix campestris]|uniref:Cardiolipin synthase N-terminal domain-containing protein n=1 Tax=Brochothrix campestris FSL F6-1037 TaxID=1265861 RepID=W7CKE1_9LIST|nr:PLD nuclease N-terminal domain-containing protein [Brochothrix campestris]EUJ36291.1 hypothetical protein BCAMP_10780 [Brochothrix campestris FSL F6-1037]
MALLMQYQALLIPFFIAQLVLMVSALVHLYKQPAVRGLPKWAWVVVIVFINFIGPIVYFLIGKKEGGSC